MHHQDHAIVLGAGIAGLLAARVLTDTFHQVTIIERDALTDGSDATRRGVPQGAHGHAVMPRGAQIFDELLPGVLDQMVADGAVRAEPFADFLAIVGGHVFQQAPVGVPAVQASRPFLERHLRERVAALGGVRVRDACDTVGLVASDAGVGGVRVMDREPGSAEETIAADLVVDATGRGSRTPVWLEAMGYERPPEDCPRVGVGYATRILRVPDDAGMAKSVLIGPLPGRARAMVLNRIEDGYSILTLLGVSAAHRPPTDPEAFLEFVDSVAPAHVARAVRAADPVGGITPFSYPSYQRRHFDRLRRLPDGLVVVGDAMYSFSPVYAQGMTVAGMQAQALGRCLVAGQRRLPARYFRAAKRLLDDPWQLAVSADLALPEVEGRRTPKVRLMNAYVGKVQAAAATDPAVARQFGRVIGLLDPPTSLATPAMLRRVLRRRDRGTSRVDGALDTTLPHFRSTQPMTGVLR